MTTKGKNYNSIVFLTTLSVYLGLVLAGGAGVPQVMAQAALTRNFDVNIEAEVKDDLDKKPPDDDSDLVRDVETIKNLNLARAIIGFTDDLKKLKSIGRVNYETDLNFSYKLWNKETFSGGVSSTKIGDISNPWVDTALDEQLSTADWKGLISISDVVSDCEGKSCRETSLKIESSDNEFHLKFPFNKSNAQKARLTAEKFGGVFASKKDAPKDDGVRRIYENTKVASENNQVFIVTRLPRGSIDSLLATTTNAN